MSSGLKDERSPILLIDDDADFCDLVAEFLEPFGYDVDYVHDGQTGLKRVREGAYRAVILDVMMPGMDGFEVLKFLRRESDIPVLVLTSRGDEVDRIVGLEIGADDYIPKTFSARELLARLRAVLRRVVRAAPQAADAAELPLVAGSLHVDPGSRSVRLDGNELELTRLEFDLLLLLVRSKGRVLTRDHLYERVAGREYEWEDRAVDVHMSSLRKKLGDDPRAPRFIKTVRGVGYMFRDNPEKPA